MPSKLLQSCPTPCNAMDSSPPGSSVHGILWARILEWVAIAFSRRVIGPHYYNQAIWVLLGTRIIPHPSFPGMVPAST